MKTSTILGFALCLSCTFGVFAQTSDAETEAAINYLSVQKKEAIKKLVPVTGKDSVAFWKIYDEYDKLNRPVMKSRVKLYESTVKAYSNMTVKTADELAAKYFTNRKEQEKSLEEYYKKIKTATNSIVAFEFYQAETFLLTQFRANIMSQVPTYGEVQNMGKKP